jgi:predicted dehydrogenase
VGESDVVDTIRWGIIAPGGIARKFAADLALVDDATLAAVGSRGLDKARAFASEFGGEAAYGSYGEVADDPAVDVVYVANPHAFHQEAVMLCLEAGKRVLCEKPLTLNARTSGVLVGEARRRDLFLMEAMWMRCNPNIRKMQALIAEGAIGDVTSLVADYGFFPGNGALKRYSDPGLGASALLDIGVYLLHFAWTFLGAPNEVKATGTLSPERIDKAVSTALGYPSGATAALECTFQADTPGQAYVGGTRGNLVISNGFHAPRSFVLTSAGERTTHAETFIGHGFTYEIQEVHRCIRAGATESSLVPLDDTLAIMQTMDAIRGQVGSVLPGD